MTPYVMQDISEKEYELFLKIRAIVKEMPDIDLGKDQHGRKAEVSCHMITRALAKFFSVLQLKDGYVNDRMGKHSWLMLNHRLIIDPYPWAMVGGPIMILRAPLTPWRHFYETECTFPEFSEEPFLTRCAKVAEAVGETIKTLNLS